MKTHKVKDQWVAHIKLLTAVKFCSSTDLHWCFVTQYDLMWLQMLCTRWSNPMTWFGLHRSIAVYEVFCLAWFFTLIFTQMNIRCSALSLWHHTWTFYFLRSKINCFKGSVKIKFYDSLLTVTKCVDLQKWVWSILRNVIYILPCFCTFFKNICRLKRYASFQNHFFYIS